MIHKVLITHTVYSTYGENTVGGRRRDNATATSMTVVDFETLAEALLCIEKVDKMNRQSQTAVDYRADLLTKGND